MWLSTLLVIGGVVQATLQTPNTSPTADCHVASFFNLSLAANKKTQATFLGCINNAEIGAFMNVTLHENKLPYKSIECSHSHIKTTNMTNPYDNEVTSEAVSWPVCSAWRQFRLAVHHNNTLTIADDHNNTWVNTSIRSSTLNLQVTVNHLNSSCITQTPVWEVEGGIPKDIVVPHCADALHFSLQATTHVTPLLTVGNVSLALSQLSPAQPRLRLTVKSTPGAAPRVVSVGVWRTVVEVGSASSTFSLSSPKDTFTLLQHLHLQEGQAQTQDYRETVQGSGLQGHYLSLVLTAIVVVLAAIVCALCIVLVKTKKIPERPREAPRKVPERAVMPPRESQLYMEPLPAPPGAAPHLPPYTPTAPPSPASTHGYQNVDGSSSDYYDDFESYS